MPISGGGGGGDATSIKGKTVNDAAIGDGKALVYELASDTIIYALGGAPAAHNILSASHGDSLAATVVRGDLIRGNATPAWARLAIGAANAILKTDGSDPLWGLIVNANIDAAAAIVYSKLVLTASIVNADIALAAAIAYSKLNLTGCLLTADIATAEFNVANKLLKLDASALVPLAQIPTPLTGKAANVLRETAGPTDLTLGSVADGEYLKRSGATVVGGTGGSGYCIWSWVIGSGAAITFGQTRYAPLNGIGAHSSVEAGIRSPMTRSGTAQKMIVKVLTNTLDDVCVVTMRKNGADTAVTVSIPAGSTTQIQDTTHSFTFVVGDEINYKIIAAGTTGSTTLSISSEGV